MFRNNISVEAHISTSAFMNVVYRVLNLRASADGCLDTMSHSDGKQLQAMGKMICDKCNAENKGAKQ